MLCLLFFCHHMCSAADHWHVLKCDFSDDSLTFLIICLISGAQISLSRSSFGSIGCSVLHPWPLLVRLFSFWFTPLLGVYIVTIHTLQMRSTLCANTFQCREFVRESKWPNEHHKTNIFIDCCTRLGKAVVAICAIFYSTFGFEVGLFLATFLLHAAIAGEMFYAFSF